MKSDFDGQMSTFYEQARDGLHAESRRDAHRRLTSVMRFFGYLLASAAFGALLWLVFSTVFETDILPPLFP